VDPSQTLSAVQDLAIAGDRITGIGRDLSRTSAREVVDATGCVVTPGLIDAHVHVYEGVAPLGIAPDPTCIAKGVTTAIDAGSAGAHTFIGFRRYVINVAATRIFALLNISVIGQSSLSSDDTPYGELLDLRYASPAAAIRVVQAHRDVILGLKVRLSRNIVGERDLAALALAKEASDAVQLPLMVHIGDTHSPLRDILSLLGKDDVVTHVFHGRQGGILDEYGRVLMEVSAAVERGVRLDVGHGRGSFSFEVAEAALREGVLPGTISSDVHRWNVNGPVFDLATTLSKFLQLGLTLDQVIERATTNPAKAFRMPHELGSLSPGSQADVAIFSMVEGDFEFQDAPGPDRPVGRRIGHLKLVPWLTVKSGRVYSPNPLHESRPVSNAESP